MLEDDYELLLNPREDRYFVHDKEYGLVSGLSEIVWEYLGSIGAEDYPYTVMFGGEDGDVLITDAPTIPFEEQTIPLEDVFDGYFQHKNQIKFESTKWNTNSKPKSS